MEPSICLVGLKDVPNDNLNDNVHTYLESLILLCEPLKLVRYKKQLYIYLHLYKYL